LDSAQETGRRAFTTTGGPCNESLIKSTQLESTLSAADAKKESAQKTLLAAQGEKKIRRELINVGGKRRQRL
jgi:hypothetical protein